MRSSKSSCLPGCDADRRQFLKASAATAAAISLPSLILPSAYAAPSPSSAAETIVSEFYGSLSEGQRKAICLGFDDPLRSRAGANWHVTKPIISDDFYSDSQRAMIEKIVREVTSDEGHERLLEQVEYDDGGLGAYSVAIFGNPSGDAFQWILTGRHLTLRADGNSVAKTAFGGPMVYGHGEESKASDNLFFYQTKRVNEVFGALDKRQAETALLTKPPAENNVRLQGKDGRFSGIAVSELSSDQKELVRSVLGTILAPYRSEDAEESLAIIEAGGGIDALRLAFYSQNDLHDDRVWDIWRIEGPNSVIHFRGAPHVHAYIHIAEQNPA